MRKEIERLFKFFKDIHNITKQQSIRIKLLEGKINQLIDAFNNHYGNNIEYLNIDITHGCYDTLEEIIEKKGKR